jgi:hypothetical protein
MVANFVEKNMLLPYNLELAGFKGSELFNVSIREHRSHPAVPHGAVTYPKKPRGSREELDMTSQIYSWPTTHRMQIF